MKQGMFITLEGIEGSGKTTQAQTVAAWLAERRIDFVLTREPGGTSIGQAIRGLLLDPASSDLDPVAELLLYNGDRVQHINTFIKPNLDAGRTVVCDRFFDSTMAYQAVARRLGVELVSRLHDLVCDGLLPDLTLLLDLDPDQGLKRTWRQVDAGGRSRDETRFENEKLEFHKRVRKGYLDLAARDPGRIKVVDASGPPGQVAGRISEILENFLGKYLKDGK